MGIPQQVSFDLSSVEARDLPKVTPNTYFLCFVKHKDRGAWRVQSVGGIDTWVPVLSVCPLAAGTNGVRVAQKGEPPQRAWERTRERLREQGATVLDTDLRVPQEFCIEGAQPGPLVRAAEVVGGRYWHHAFEYFEETVGGGERVACDREALGRFLAHMVETGVIPAPPKAVIAEYVGRMKGRAEQHGANDALVEDQRNRLVRRYSDRAEAATKALVPGATPPVETKAKKAPQRAAESA